MKADPKKRLRKSKIKELRSDIRAAREAGSWSALAQLHRQEIQLKGLDDPPYVPDPRPLPDDPLEAAAERAKRLGRKAELAGSWVAARDFLREEQSIRERIAARTLQAEEAARRATSDGDVVGKFRAELDGLPDVLVEQLQDACEDRLRGQPVMVDKPDEQVPAE